MGIFINELHYDNDGADLNEFVELGGEADANLDGFSLVLYNGSGGASYNTVQLQGALGNDGNGFGTRIVSYPRDGIQNGSPDGVALVDPQGAVIEFISYEGTLTATNGPAAGMRSTDIGVMEGSSTPAGSSLQRTGTGTDGSDFTWSGPSAATPGAANNGQTFVPGDGSEEPTDPVEPTDPIVTLISEIQGSGADSTMVGRTVTVEAIVVGDFQDGDADNARNLGGFYLQEEDADGDGDASTSEGIFVFQGSLGTDVKIGDKVRLTAVVDEYFGETQLTDVSAIEVIGSDVALPTAAVIALPTTGTTSSQNGDAQPDLEAFEGMLVTVEETLTITEQFQLDRFNEIKLFDTNGFEQSGPAGTTITGERPFQFSQFNEPDAAGNAAYLETTGARTITYDDGLNVQNGSIDTLDGFQGYNTATAPRMGDTVTGLSGILDYKWAGNSTSGATWRIRATEDDTNNFESGNPRPTETLSPDGNLKVAAFNVLNFFTTLDDFPDSGADDVGPGQNQEPRGADENPQDALPGVGPTSEYDRQLSKLVEAISGLDADILSLIEIENDFLDGGASPGDQGGQEPRPTAIQALVDALNERQGMDVWAAVDPGEEFVGGDAIAVGMIYRTDAVRIAEGTSPAILTDADVDASILARSTVDNDGATEGGSVFSGPNTSRSPLAVTFEELSSGEELTVVANHFKSKGGSGEGLDADAGDGAGSFNNMRVLAAEALDAWLKTNPTGSDTANMMLVGDFNAYASEDPIDYLTETAGFVDVAAELLDTAYSYLFDGLLGTLDYTFASIELFNQIVDAVAQYINADEADALDYNLEFGRDPDIFDGDSPVRSSDHDPVVVGIDLESSEEPVPTNFTLELLHFSDQEGSSGAIEDAPNLSAVLNALRAQDLGDDGVADNTLTLSSGDLFIPGVFANAGAALYGAAGIADIQIQNELGVQASALGNHDFDFGTAALAALINGSAGEGTAAGGRILGADFAGTAFPYLSANLDVSTDPNLAPLEVEGGQAPQGGVATSSTVIDVNGEKIGIVGATTPTLDRISSSGGVTITPMDFDDTPTPEQLDALAAVIQAEVDAVLAANPGMDKVILSSHMQRISIEQELATRLSGVDIIIAGGSNTRLFDENDRPRDGDSEQGQYPIFSEDADGNPIAIVNTDGSYKYVGRLAIEFDENGHIVADSYDADVSGAYATDDAGVDALDARDLVDAEIQQIVDEIETQVIATEGNVFGVSDVFLNGERSGTGSASDPDGVRTQETNLGNVTADANLAYANRVAGELGEEEPVLVSIKNGGGIRGSIGQITVPAGSTEAVRLANEAIFDSEGNLIKPEGGISQNDIQTSLAFNNSLSLVTLTRAELVAILEFGVGAVESAAGRFPQLSGIEMSFDPSLPAGSRIQNASIVDANGEAIANLVVDGEIAGDPEQTFRVVTLSFLVDGGDGYPFPASEGLDRVDLNDLDENGVADGVSTGDATFAQDGTEQDAFAEYLDDNFRDTPYAEADVGPEGDERLQNLDLREDEVSLVDGDVDDSPILGTIGDDVLRGTEGDDRIEGLGGDDRLLGLAGNDTILGGEGDDTIRGGDGRDAIDGGAGDDVIRGENENDSIFGASGNDELFGDAGNDRIDGGEGDDRVNGGLGDDILIGGAGRDRIVGGEGNDVIDSVDPTPEADEVRTGAGDDVVVGGRLDYLNGGAGNDRAVINFGLGVAGVAPLVLLSNAAGAIQANDGTFLTGFETVEFDLTDGDDAASTGNVAAVIRARNGDDTVLTGTANDQLFGGEGDDTLSAGAGDDALDGEAGDDFLLGGAGNDTIAGGDGADIAAFFGTADGYGFARGEDGAIVVTDTDASDQGEGVDTLSGVETLRFAGTDYLVSERGTDGNDILFADLSGGRLSGGSGNDILVGDAGDDRLFGDAGDDRLQGGAGDDRLEGGSGNDTLLGGSGDNRVDGGSGSDAISGGSGDDDLRGGSGDDRIVLGGGSDKVDGGSGSDTVVFAGAAADYQGSRSFNGFDLTSDGQSADLRGVERIIFDDVEVDLTDGGEAYDSLFSTEEDDGPSTGGAGMPWTFPGSGGFGQDFASSADALQDLMVAAGSADAEMTMERFGLDKYQDAHDSGYSA